MFARMESFEPILYSVHDDGPLRRLSTVVRLWVNMLRAGKLIPSDIAGQLRTALAENGWDEAARDVQQDASEGFVFITEKLSMPLLTLKMDIAHGGKDAAADDHKFINERLLAVPVPGTAADPPIRLEACLEEYFANSVTVRRQIERRLTMDSVARQKRNSVHIETVEVPAEMTSAAAAKAAEAAEESANVKRTARRSSVKTGRPHLRRAGSSRQEISLMAWAFLQLLPFYTDSAATGSGGATMAEHFAHKRPVMVVCLKRYTWAGTRGVRNERQVIVPESIDLPKIVADDMVGRRGNHVHHGRFRLVLEAAICHRGKSLSAGHYISLVRDSVRGSDPASRAWLKFDDMGSPKVSHTTLAEGLSSEFPYLLFYRMTTRD
ncbi:PAB-dependent poly(A)-specific ribonuclease subunit PAN2, partial [Dipodascopsis tothii]|uniref:PAB-dependent poly(A)-specific ribonuclease subunit PAN2 n=1 Tax=Dipodascopsis tothii TaxID=44089 RepID=UPI0034CD7053